MGFWSTMSLPAIVVGVAQLAEHRVVVPGVVGSIPITHPSFFPVGSRDTGVGRQETAARRQWFFPDSRFLSAAAEAPQISLPAPPFPSGDPPASRAALPEKHPVETHGADFQTAPPAPQASPLQLRRHGRRPAVSAPAPTPCSSCNGSSAVRHRAEWHSRARPGFSPVWGYRPPYYHSWSIHSSQGSPSNQDAQQGTGRLTTPNFNPSDG